MITFNLNGRAQTVDIDPETPLLWALRDHLRLTGTKFGCGEGLCGACTVHIDGEARRSCITPLRDAAGKNVRTIEGVPSEHPVKQAWLAEEVSQCGYCQPGQIMSAVSLLEKTRNPTEREIDDAMSGNLCRCGTYGRIKKAVRSVAAETAKGGKKP